MNIPGSVNSITTNSADTNHASVSNEELTEDVVLKQYTDVFSGTFPGECHIEIDPNAKPVQHVARRVPVA